MALPLPRLDTHTYDSLVSDALTLLPRYAPVWTDHNAHDPGITLIELFAWLAEMELYRLDRVTDASTRSFLQLVGIKPRPAQVAETVLVLMTDALGPTVLVPSRTKVMAVAPTVEFQTTHPVKVSRAKLTAVFAGAEGALVDHTRDNTPTSKRFFPFGTEPHPGDALYLGFDTQLADTSDTINLYLWSGESESDRQTKQSLILESQLSRKSGMGCRYRTTTLLSTWRSHYSVRTVWEYYAEGNQWLPLAKVSDRTRGLTLSGALRFAAPDPSKHISGGVSFRNYSALYFIRCRLVSGSYDCPPQIQFVAINTVRVRHAVDAQAPVSVSHSNGRAGQTYLLPENPIVPGSTQVQVRLPSVVQNDWNEHLTWDRVGPNDRGYVLDPERGEVQFGNGRSGAVPKAGAEILITYQTGGSPTGNVPANTEWSVIHSPLVTVSQPFAASGGTAAESLFDAKARAVMWLTKPQRAVTLEDFEQLALATPGVPVSRAKALADYDPKLTCVAAPGSVTVVVIPRCTETHPVPGPDLLRTVAQYLERRRLLTTELHVIGPEYTKVAVHVTLHVMPESAPKELIDQAITALNHFFDPIDGGPEGKGWPMGRAVYRSEILALLNALPGVAFVDELMLQTIVEAPTATSEYCQRQEKTVPAQCGNVEICPHGLVMPGQHQIKVSIERAE